MNLTIIKSIFCPNDAYFKKTLDSLFDLNRLLLPNRDFKLIIIGYTKKQEYIDKIKSIHFMVTPIYHIFNVNYGKVFMLNHLIKNFDKNTGELLFLDHDILVNNHLNRKLISESLAVLNHAINGKSIGLVALNQMNDNRHMNFLIKAHKRVKINSHSVHYTDLDGCVGIGAFFMKWDVLRAIGQLELKNVYGTDDYLLAKRLRENGMLLGIIDGIAVNHPYDSNKEYTKWKKTISSIDNYWLSVEESNNFWSSVLD